MPQATDLVTDLPADFEVFGQAVATSMADLLGGTTGQILAKNSNTDMDFTWVTNDVGDITAVTAGTGISGGGTSGAVTITNSMATEITAKGDLIVGTGSATFDNLASGSNGETLVADSSTSTGLRYTAGTVQANPILNSAMQVWQRGTSIACSTTAYTADRWQGYRSVAGATVSRQVTGDTTNLPNIQYCARVQRDSGNTSTATIYLAQTLESVNSIPYAGKIVTLSYYARKGANFSDADYLRVTLQQAASTDANVLTSMSSSTVVNVDATLTTTWQRFTATGTVLSTTTQLGLYAEFVPVGTAGAADYFEITGVQIDIGSVALPFRTYAGTIQGELAACQRYYVRLGTSTGGSDQRLARGVANQTTTIQFTATLPVQLRTGNSTTMDFSGLQAYDGNAVFAVSAVASSSISTLNPAVVATVSGATVKQFYELLTTTTSGYIAFSAEL